MRKSFEITFIILAIAFFTNCEEVVDNGSNKKTIKTITAAPGLLIHQLTVDEMQTLTELRLEGSIDYRDFEVFRSFMPKLEYLDMSDLTIVEYRINNYRTLYEKDALPAEAFFEENKMNTILETIILPKSLKSIGGHAFNGCTGLTSITIPSSVISIGNGAFSKCTGLTSITLPTSVTSISDGTFWYCNSLTSITIPSSVTYIGSSAFYGCTGLTSITIPSSVTSISNGAFSGFSGLIKVSSENQNYSSKDGVLYNKSFTELIKCPISIKGEFVILSSITSISGVAFYGCTGLTSITIPSSVISIGNGAFSGCTLLSEIIIQALTPPELGTDVFFYLVDKSACILYVPKGCLDAYKSAPQWKDFLNIIELDFSGITDTQLEKIKLHPNPASSYINISLETFTSKTNLLVYNTVGSLVLEKELVDKDNSLDISFLPNGIYILYTTDNNSVVKGISRFIKK